MNGGQLKAICVVRWPIAGDYAPKWGGAEVVALNRLFPTKVMGSRCISKGEVLTDKKEVVRTHIPIDHGTSS